MRSELKACLRANLREGLDAQMQSSGFSRRQDALTYTRKLPGVVQRIEVGLEVHPMDRRDASAAVYPYLDVRMDSVTAALLEMTGGDENLVVAIDVTLRQPIEHSSAKAAPARWFIFQPDSVPGIVSELRSFLRQWTLPLLDLCSTPAGICEAYQTHNERLTNDLGQALRVVAALLLCGRKADAIGIMERRFGAPGPRKQYQRVFDFLNRNR